LQNQQGPSLPPKPRKLLNPEDSFAFEIIDTDELRPVQTMNMAVMSFSSQNPPKSQAVSCTKLKETGRCEAHGLNVDSAVPKSNNNEALPRAFDISSTKKMATGEAGVEAGVPCSTDGTKSISNNYHKRPMKLAVKDASCNDNGNIKASEGFPIVSAPLATPEQDSSLVDSSSLENLLDEEDAVFLIPDNEVAVGETCSCPVPESLSNMQQDMAPSHSSASTNESSKYQSCEHSWPVNDLQVLCSGNQSSKSKDVSSSHGTDQDGSSQVSIGGVLTDACAFGVALNNGKLQLCPSISDSPVTTRPRNFPLHAPQLESANTVSFHDVVCEMPVILTDIPNRENQVEAAVSSAGVPSDSVLHNTDTSSLLSVPNPLSLTSVSPISPNSLSDSGMALSTATERSTSSGSDTNTMVLSNHSSSTDSLGTGVTVSAHVDITNCESGEREFENFSKNLGLQSRDDETVSSCIDVIDVDEENAAEDSAEFVDASGEESVCSNSPSLRTHKPLSRQVSHPPMTSLGQRTELSATHFCSAARLPLQRQIGNETLATAPRPRNR
jgi:hypothetical protein